MRVTPGRKMKTPEIPNWMRDLPDGAFIGSAGICDIFGISMQSIGRSISRGRLPAPDRLGKFKNGGKVKHWILGNLRAYIARSAIESTQGAT